MPVVLGYIQVRTNASSVGIPMFTQPLNASVPSIFHTDPTLDDLDALRALNPVNIGGSGAPELEVGCMVTKTATEQALDFAVKPLVSGAPVTDIRLELWVNTTYFTNTPQTLDYAQSPTPKQGESFVVFGTQTNAFQLKELHGHVSLTKLTDPGLPTDLTRISIGSHFDEPRVVIVGQIRERTTLATFTSNGQPYRRSVGPDKSGLYAEMTPSGTSPDLRYLHVTIRSPRTPDAPATALACAAVPPPAGSPARIPLTGKRSYQVTWMRDGNESSPSPLSAPVATTTGCIAVPVPVWTDPHDRDVLGPIVTPPATARRIYRTATSTSGTSGDALLVREFDDDTTTSFVDDVADADLGEPLLTRMKVHVRHSSTDLVNNAATAAEGLTLARRVPRDLGLRGGHRRHAAPPRHALQGAPRQGPR